MDLQALLQMFLESENAPGNTLAIFTEKIKAFAAAHGYEITDAQIAKGLEVMQNLYGQYQRGEEMDLASVASAFMSGEDNGLAPLASMFMGGEQGGADMMSMLGGLAGGAQQEGGMDLASMAQMVMQAQGQKPEQNADMAQLASMFLNNK